VASQQIAVRCVMRRFAKLGFARTASRLMDKLAYVPREPQ
jgi:hypothetical protein